MKSQSVAKKLQPNFSQNLLIHTELNGVKLDLKLLNTSQNYQKKKESQSLLLGLTNFISTNKKGEKSKKQQKLKSHQILSNKCLELRQKVNYFRREIVKWNDPSQTPNNHMTIPYGFEFMATSQALVAPLLDISNIVKRYEKSVLDTATSTSFKDQSKNGIIHKLMQNQSKPNLRNKDQFASKSLLRKVFSTPELDKTSENYTTTAATHKLTIPMIEDSDIDININDQVPKTTKTYRGFSKKVTIKTVKSDAPSSVDPFHDDNNSFYSKQSNYKSNNTNFKRASTIFKNNLKMLKEEKQDESPLDIIQDSNLPTKSNRKLVLNVESSKNFNNKRNSYAILKTNETTKEVYLSTQGTLSHNNLFQKNFEDNESYSNIESKAVTKSLYKQKKSDNTEALNTMINSFKNTGNMTRNRSESILTSGTKLFYLKNQKASNKSVIKSEDNKSHIKGDQKVNGSLLQQFNERYFEKYRQLNKTICHMTAKMKKNGIYNDENIHLIISSQRQTMVEKLKCQYTQAKEIFNHQVQCGNVTFNDSQILSHKLKDSIRNSSRKKEAQLKTIVVNQNYIKELKHNITNSLSKSLKHEESAHDTSTESIHKLKGFAVTPNTFKPGKLVRFEGIPQENQSTKLKKLRNKLKLTFLGKNEKK